MANQHIQHLDPSQGAPDASGAGVFALPALKNLHDAAAHALAQAGWVGEQSAQNLSAAITTTTLMRRGADVVGLKGPAGSGKAMVAKAIHLACQQGLQRHGDLVLESLANIGDEAFEKRLLAAAHRAQGGTLFLRDSHHLSQKNQDRLARFLASTASPTHNILVLIGLKSDAEVLGTVIEEHLGASIAIPALCRRGAEINALAQHFATAAALEAGAAAEDFYGFSRRALAAVENAVAAKQETSVRRLRHLVRNIVFEQAPSGLADALESPLVISAIESQWRCDAEGRQKAQKEQLKEGFEDLLVGTQLRGLAKEHGIRPSTLKELVRGMEHLIEDLDDNAKSYRDIVDQSNRLSKIALWLVSGAKTQAQFRRFFGDHPNEMPTKSVAHHIYHLVFPKPGGEGKQ